MYWVLSVDFFSDRYALGYNPRLLGENPPKHRAPGEGSSVGRFRSRRKCAGKIQGLRLSLVGSYPDPPADPGSFDIAA